MRHHVYARPRPTETRRRPLKITDPRIHAKMSRIYPSARFCQAQFLVMLRRMRPAVISHDHLVLPDRTDTAAFCLRCSPQAQGRKNGLINESYLGQVVNRLEDNSFDDLPLLLAVRRRVPPRRISRVRRLGGRVYVVTACFAS